MLRFVRNVVILLFVCALFAPQTFAQLHPLPGSENEAPVLCTGCQGQNASGQPNDGLKTYPYGSPIKDHVGRYVDSTSTASFQHNGNGFRTARARYIRTVPEQRGSAPPSIYIQIGNALAAYRLDTFFTQALPGGMQPITGIKTGQKIGGFGRKPPEKILNFAGFVYPEAVDSKWFCGFIDDQDPMGFGAPFDFDDRGNIYVAYTGFGWGISKDDGRSDASIFPTIVQLVAGGTNALTQQEKARYPYTLDDTSTVPAASIVSLKVGSKYYAITAGTQDKDAVWDVTTPAAPRLILTRDAREFGIRTFDKNDNLEHIAVVSGDRRLRVYTYDAFVGGSNPPPIYESATTFADVSYDEQGNLWAAESNSKIWKLTPAGDSYTAVSYSPHTARFDHLYLHAGAGHVVVAGTDHEGGLAYDVKLFKVTAGGLQFIDTDDFFTKYYHRAPANYAQPAGYNSIGVQADVQLVKSGGKTYLMYSCIGLGDVYEIEGEDSIDIKLKNNNFGTLNPNSKGTPGPYPGDIVTFTAPSTNPQVVYDVTWDFGNPESTDNTGLKKSNQEITHQYTGLNTSAKITQPKHVKAITVQSAGVSSQYTLNLKVPTPRVGVSGIATPLTANTTGLKVVAGQTFNDASDGSVEGHYGTWTIDGVATKLKPNESIAVGEVGSHTLQFQAAYGKYDASFNGTSPYTTSPITVTYTVLPFRATINAPTSSGTNVIFTGQPLVAPAPTVTAATWAVTWTFNPGGTSTSAVITETKTANINTIPSFTVPKAEVVTGSTVTLKVEVDAAGLSVPAQDFKLSTDTMTLQAPDPVITRTGCSNAGSPCTFTASSTTDPAMTGWTFAWTLTGPGGVTKTGNINPWSPELDVPGNYSISLKATKSIFEKTVSQNLPTVEGSLCEPLPDSSKVSITKINCPSGTCPVGTTVRFTPAFFGYSHQDCDIYTWTFGSGQGGATGLEVEHTYNTAGTYTVTLKITQQGRTASLTETVDLTIGNGGGNDGGSGGTCTAPTSASITLSGCSTGGCRTNDVITFNAKRGGANLQSCDSVEWTFQGTSPPTSIQKSPNRTFPTPGTYTVTAKIKNQHGESPVASTNVTITQAPSGGSCQTAPGPGNFAITYTGTTSPCTNASGTPCQPNETINFDAPDYLYAPAACDEYEWDFGDNSPKVRTRQASHAYATSGVFHVELRVHNDAGEWTYTRTVTVQGQTPGKPIPQITATSFPSSGVKGRTVTFTATSNNPNTTGWTWNFGDNTGTDGSQAGQTKQSSTITHTFSRTGTFTVRVTARNAEDVATAPVGQAQGSITVTDAPAIPEYRFLLPVAAHVGGLGGSQWRTDIQIYNADPNVGTETTPLEMELDFNGVKYPLHLIKSTHIYEDIVGQLLNHQADGQGPIIITTKNATVAPMIWTRTYNQSANGTFGQFIPAIRIDNAAENAVTDGKYYIAGLRHDERYRTNLGFLNPNATTITATITVFDDDHFAIGQFTRTLQPFQLDPINQLKNHVPNLPTDRPFSLEIQVPPGNWLVGYASFVDNKSQDPVYLQAVHESEVASADFTTTIIPGVGHTGPWRSDVTIFNPDSQGLEFTLQYFDNGGNKLAETPGIRIDPRKFIQYSDILKQGVLGGSVPDGLGTLKIVNTSINGSAMLQPMSFARTFNDDGANGTFGQAIPAFSAARANVRPNKPALIAGVRNNDAYYTNIGLLNLSNTTVTATVTLLDPVSGGAIASIPYTLAPNQTVVGQYSGFGSVTSGTLKVEANGNVWAFCSVVDRKTRDPEYVSAVTLP